MGEFIRASWVLALAVLTACGGRSAEVSAEPEGPAMVQVENQGFSDMVIYALDGAQRVRLGLVTGHSTKTLPIPRYLIGTGGTLRFLADPIGGNRTPASEEMTVQPGDVVSLTIPPQ
jgi:hypothetical protein